MSKIETNTIAPSTGTTLTLGENGDTVALGSGATATGFGGDNTPAFQAYNSSDQGSMGDNTYTKLILNTELYDTDNAYDNSSNYRFTPQVAGKYYCYGQVTIAAQGGNDDAKELGLKFYKNGSAATNLVRQSLYNLGYHNTPSLTLSAVIDFNGSSDYIELYAKINTVANGTNSTAVGNESRFGAYKLIGV